MAGNFSHPAEMRASGPEGAGKFREETIPCADQLGSRHFSSDQVGKGLWLVAPTQHFKP